jgi:hypothetical protein
MNVRIRLPRGLPVDPKRGKNRHVALACGALMGPAALMAYVLGAWRLASDMGLAGEFVITGLFSHWQVWIALGVLLQAAASSLNRYGRGGHIRLPRALMIRMFPVRPRPHGPEGASIPAGAAVVDPKSGASHQA